MSLKFHNLHVPKGLHTNRIDSTHKHGNKRHGYVTAVVVSNPFTIPKQQDTGGKHSELGRFEMYC